MSTASFEGSARRRELLRIGYSCGYRGTRRAAKPAAAAGLGLAIAPAVVEADNGSISARNVAGGCRFDINLPAQPSVSGQE
jgi:K+-sensing histidine kinase KdpD